jgi:hypothetical protein
MLSTSTPNILTKLERTVTTASWWIVWWNHRRQCLSDRGDTRTIIVLVVIPNNNNGFKIKQWNRTRCTNPCTFCSITLTIKTSTRSDTSRKASARTETIVVRQFDVHALECYWCGMYHRESSCENCSQHSNIRLSEIDKTCCRHFRQKQGSTTHSDSLCQDSFGSYCMCLRFVVIITLYSSSMFREKEIEWKKKALRYDVIKS